MIIFTFSLSFPLASFSLLALFQTSRRHRCRLLRQRLNFSTPRDVVTSDLVSSGRRWSPSDWQSEHSCCRHRSPEKSPWKARYRSSLPVGHGVTVLDPDSCRVVTELKTVDVSQLQCSDKVIDVPVEQVVVLDRPVLGQGRLHARCRAVLRQGGRCPFCAVRWVPQVQFVDGYDVPVIIARPALST